MYRLQEAGKRAVGEGSGRPRYERTETPSLPELHRLTLSIPSLLILDPGAVPLCPSSLCKGRKGALVKPDIVFFGESLPDKFFAHLTDLASCDLLLVFGTSLKVHVSFRSFCDRVVVQRLNPSPSVSRSLRSSTGSDRMFQEFSSTRRWSERRRTKARARDSTLTFRSTREVEMVSLFPQYLDPCSHRPSKRSR